MPRVFREEETEAEEGQLMPTGYTADVADGKLTDFAIFALQCARQFGATIMQRDEPMSSMPRLREESSYYREAREKAEKTLAELEKLGPKEAERRARAEYRDLLARHEGAIAERSAKRERYQAMLEKVRTWTPPTSQHRELKKFMEQQLTESIKFDCSWSFEPPTQLTGPQWLAAKREKARKGVEYYRKEEREERDRVAGANAWIEALYASLQTEMPKAARQPA